MKGGFTVNALPLRNGYLDVVMISLWCTYDPSPSSWYPGRRLGRTLIGVKGQKAVADPCVLISALKGTTGRVEVCASAFV